MTVKQLQDALAALIKRDAYLADASVTYGNAFEPVEGGIITKSKSTGLVTLNLAPVALPDVGGF
jgi:hypothetical protein